MKPIDYLYADIAGRFGKDKISWKDRMLFTLVHKDELEDMVGEAKEPILFARAVKALRDVEEGNPTGHAVMFDCSASGMQLLSILTGDVNGARISNVIGSERLDPYTEVYNTMLDKLGENAVLERDDVKQAIMTSLYGSEAEPEKLFAGSQLEAFYESMEETVPLCWELNKFLLDFLKTSMAESYDWVMPDNFHVKCPVVETVFESVRCLGQTVTVGRKVQQPHHRNRSLGANLTHSVESFITRELLRRCNTPKRKIKYILRVLDGTVKNQPVNPRSMDMAAKLVKLYNESGFLSARILDYVDTHTIEFIDREALTHLVKSLPEKTFSIITVHDCFAVHPNNASDLLWQYQDLYNELSKANMLSYLLKQVIDPEIELSINPITGIKDSSYILS